MKTAGFAAILLLVTIAALELGARVLIAVSDRWPPREALAASLQTSLSATQPGDAATPRRKAGRKASNVLHPYLGYVRNEQEAPVRVNRLVVDETVNEYGFLGPSPLSPKPDATVRIAITGGSVAEELYVYGRAVLVEQLKRSKAFGDREIEVVSLAVAGFKQPQQLMAASYLLALGADLDALVNLDGFNEVVLPYTDNVRFKIAPSYPFRWTTVATGGIDPETARLVAEVSEIQERLDLVRARLARSAFRHSAFALTVWHAYHERGEAALGRAEAALADRLASADASLPRGAPVEYASGAEQFRDAVAIWKRSSEQLWSLCRDRGVDYFHFLQPNQYVAGSRRFTAAERQLTLLAPNQATRAAAEAGYPLLIAEGARMKESGLPLFDVTGVFADVSEAVYRDSCCHYLERGYEILAKRIAQEIAAEVSGQPGIQ